MNGCLAPLFRPREFYHSCLRLPLHACKRKSFAFCYPNTLHHTIQFTSIGGVGTTFLYEFALRAQLNVMSQYDPGETGDYGIWKHTRQPLRKNDPRGINFRRNYRVVYVTGNPYNALISLFRRNYHYMALDRLEVSDAVHQRFQPDWTLRDYLATGEDLYGFNEHVKNWTAPQPPLPYPVLVIKYEHLYQNLDTLFNFLEVPQNMRSLFPQQVQRNSNFDAMSAEEQAGIQHIYQPLHDAIASMPDAFVIEANQASPAAANLQHLAT